MNSDLEKRVVTLERVSVEQQASPERAGLERQRERNRRTVEAYGLKCVDSIVLTNVSGTAVRRAPEIQRILSMIQQREIGGIVVADLDRLGRTDRFEDFALFQVFQDTGGVIYTGDAVIRPSSSEGFLSSVLKAAMAGMELQAIRARMMGGKEELRRKGRCASAAHTLPRGIAYNRATGKYGCVSPDIDGVTEAFRLVDECGMKNYCEIARRTGIKATSLKNILRNPIYAGTRVYDTKRGPEKYRSVNGRQAERKKVRRDPGEIIRAEVLPDPPVDPTRFARVQKILDETHRRWKDIRSHTPTVTFLAGGIAACAECGSPLYGSAHPKKSGKTDCYYRCRSNVSRFRERSGGCRFAHIRREPIDQALRQFVSDVLSKPAMVRRLIEQVLNSERAGITEAKTPEAIAAAITKLDRRRGRLVDAYEAEELSLDELSVRTGALQAQRSTLESLLKQAQMPQNNDIVRTAKRIAKGALAFRRISDPQEQKIIIDQMLSKVTFRESKIVTVAFRPQFALEDGMPIEADTSAMH